MAAGMDWKRGIENFYKFATEGSPASRIIGGLESSGFLGGGSGVAPTPNTPAISEAPRGGAGGGSRGMSISTLERNHPEARADKGRDQYAHGGCVAHGSVSNLEKKYRG